jgi:hypothetical protein
VRRPLALIAAAIAVLVLVLVLGAGVALGSRGTHLTTVASGGTGPGRWKVAIGNNRSGEPCVRIGSETGGLITCGEEPESNWRRVAGFPAAGSRPWLEVDMTSPRVRVLRLLIGDPGSGRKPTWRRFSPALLTLEQAREARMPRDFRYVVVTEAGDACVEGVKGLDRRGRVLLDERVPCDY